MAESTTNKGKKARDSFADDLDSMLDINDTDGQQIGLIDDDDAIDRLLIGDAFVDTDLDESASAFDNIDRMIGESPTSDELGVDDIDEFGDDVDDLIANLDINPKQAVALAPESSFDLPIDSNEVEAFDLDEQDEALATNLSSVQEEVSKPVQDMGDRMSEIDDISVDSSFPQTDAADFLLADFNIADDEPLDQASQQSIASPIQEPAAADDAALDLGSAGFDQVDEFADEVLPSISAAPIAESINIPSTPAPEPPGPQTLPPQAAVDHSAALAGLTSQIQALAKLQKQSQHDLKLKADNEVLTTCLEALETLQTEQKKTRRHLDGLMNQKPTGVYIANGVAALSMMIAMGMAVEAYITKSQVGQLVEIINTMQQQAVQAPTVDAAANELLRKQVDELSVAQGVLVNQITELTKAVPVGLSSGKPVGDSAELNDRDMQMGAAIEALQNKVAALEKARGTIATVHKDSPKKPEVIEEKWVVNLVAFKQDWYAKRKAEEFAAKGIAAKVSRNDSKGDVWYRLTVDGFKSQYDAAAYAAKAKKTLNLDSVWVAKIKE
ncbi:MAG: hypothetical protein RL563_145 [Pseudomonadota bacterium]|jgi:hypothetical protein